MCVFCRENDLRTLFVAAKNDLHTFFCKNDLSTLFCCKNNLRTFFVAKTIYALRPESFCALNFAIWKVQTFWASAVDYVHSKVFDIVDVYVDVSDKLLQFLVSLTADL